jgi:hypothetical protein
VLTAKAANVLVGLAPLVELLRWPFRHTAVSLG